MKFMQRLISYRSGFSSLEAMRNTVLRKLHKVPKGVLNDDKRITGVFPKLYGSNTLIKFSIYLSAKREASREEHGQ